MNTTEKNPHHRWLIVLVAFYGCVLFSICTFFAFSLFVKPLQAAFGWERSPVAAGFTLLSLAIGFSSPFVGKAVDRFGPKRVMCFGAVLTAVAYGSLYLLNTAVHFYFSHMLIGIGGAAMGPVPCTATVSTWFDKRRGLAIGLMSTGIGVGGLVFSPIIGGWIIPSFGWRAGYIFLGFLAVSLAPLALWIVEANTAPRSERVSPLEKGKMAEAAGPTDVKSMLMSAPFLLIAGAFLLSQFSLAGIVQSQVPHLVDIGFPISAVATALGGVGMMSALGKFFFGWLCDRIEPKNVFSIGVFLMIFGAVNLVFITPDSSLTMVWVYSLSMGLGGGSWLPAMSMLVSRRFGMAAYGAVFGAVTLVMFIGVSTGPLFAGYIFDVTESYRWAFITFIVLLIGSLPAMAAVRKS